MNDQRCEVCGERPGESASLRKELASERDRLLAIAGLVNGYHNAGEGGAAEQVLSAVADALGRPF